MLSFRRRISFADFLRGAGYRLYSTVARMLFTRVRRVERIWVYLDDWIANKL